MQLMTGGGNNLFCSMEGKFAHQKNYDVNDCEQKISLFLVDNFLDLTYLSSWKATKKTAFLIANFN